jgi:hypothetical protein
MLLLVLHMWMKHNFHVSFQHLYVACHCHVHFRNKIAKFVLRDLIATHSPWRSLLWKCDSCLRCTHVCNFIGASKKRATFPAPMFTKFTNAQQHYVHVPYIEFYPNSDNKWTEIHFHPGVKYDFYCADFHETHINHPVNVVDIWRPLSYANNFSVWNFRFGYDGQVQYVLR